MNNQGSLDDYDCAVCGQTLPSLASLQAHLLASHCSQSDTLLQLVRGMQEQIIQMRTSQTSLVNDVKIIKNNVLNMQATLTPTAAPAAPVQTPPQAAPSYAAAVSAQQQQPGSQTRRVPSKISFVTDSIGDNVITTELEKITKTKI